MSWAKVLTRVFLRRAHLRRVPFFSLFFWSRRAFCGLFILSSISVPQFFCPFPSWISASSFHSRPMPEGSYPPDFSVRERSPPSFFTTPFPLLKIFAVRFRKSAMTSSLGHGFIFLSTNLVGFLGDLPVPLFDLVNIA